MNMWEDMWCDKSLEECMDESLSKWYSHIEYSAQDKLVKMILVCGIIVTRKGNSMRYRNARDIIRTRDIRDQVAKRLILSGVQKGTVWCVSGNFNLTWQINLALKTSGEAHVSLKHFQNGLWIYVSELRDKLLIHPMWMGAELKIKDW